MPTTSLQAESDSGADVRRSRRGERYRLRRVLWQVAKSKTLRCCGRATREDVVGVHAVPDGDGGSRGTVTGLVSCSSVWSCPVCSAHIRQERATEIEQAASQHLGRGGGLAMLTLTLKHNRGEALADLLDGLLKSWRLTIMGSPWKRRVQRHGIVGQVRAVEVTHGANGWHPHIHVLLFLDRELPPDELADLEGWLHARWVDRVTKHGLGKPSRDHGVRLQTVYHATLGRYLAKVQDAYGEDRGIGLEMARGDLKSGRVDPVSQSRSELPFELLDRASDGEADALRLWWEYERATKGRRCMTWSKGLRDLFTLGEERTDEQITADTEVSDETLVATLERGHWLAVCRAGLDATLLDAVERDGFEGVRRVVAVAIERTRGSHRDGCGCASCPGKGRPRAPKPRRRRNRV